MGNLGGFDAKTVEPNTGFEPLPAGDYNVAIVDSVFKTTKSGNGEYLQIELDVLDGKYAGRKLFDNLNLVNQNKKAEEIAKATLSAICRAVGVLTPDDSSELHGKPMIAKVKIRKDDQFGDRNEIKGYKASTTKLATEVLPPRGEPAPQDEIPF